MDEFLRRASDSMKWKDSGSGGSNHNPPPLGTHLARCVRIIDVGTQTDNYEGEERSKRKVIIGWELCNEPNSDDDGKPFIATQFYAQSLHEKAKLRKHLAAWRGRDFTKEELAGFDSKNILDKGCIVSVTQNENKKHVVGGVSGMMKGQTLPPRVHPLVFFSLEPGEFDQKVFDGFSDAMKAMIEKSPEYKAIKSGKPVTQLAGDGDDPSDDDVPFLR